MQGGVGVPQTQLKGSNAKKAYGTAGSSHTAGYIKSIISLEGTEQLKSKKQQFEKDFNPCQFHSSHTDLNMVVEDQSIDDSSCYVWWPDLEVTFRSVLSNQSVTDEQVVLILAMICWCSTVCVEGNKILFY